MRKEGAAIMISNHMSYAVAGTPWFPRAFVPVHSAPAAGATAAAARKRRAIAGTAAASVRGFH
ncbi:hypothetical protein EB72_05770 [Mycobacterium sp. SWH-M1]|uniref:Uncharacterized protein n=2 Tax=Mycolicibacterium obuense TaxID=1807 RepID=A0A0M2JS78_9MYCO|nr:hypothetical protein WN67_22085 [Mycolicibacterium obuense]OKH65976.1 hypothetical protein EB72_05770 [Mycobacterium sp. SWH-M1]